jgi:putative hydrolase of the HAD superfamily
MVLRCRGVTPRDDYHRVMLASVGLVDPPSSLLAELNRPLDVPVLEAFPVVIGVLEEIQRRGFPIAVVSNNWKTVAPRREPLGLDRFVAVWVISEELGCEKPDPRMYSAGSAGIDVPPAECLFVDDYYPHVEAAIALGYQGVALGRTRSHPATSVAWIDSLVGVLELLSDPSFNGSNDRGSTPLDEPLALDEQPTGRVELPQCVRRGRAFA